MERRVILAIALSLLVLLSWSAWVSKTQPIVNKAVTKEILPAQGAAVIPSTLAVPEIPATSLLKLSQEKREIIFIEPQAAIKEAVFKDYPSAKMVLGNGFLWGEENLVFRKVSLDQSQAVFVHQDKDKEIVKRFTFSTTDNYNIDLEIEVRNLSNLNLRADWTLLSGILSFVGHPDEVRYQDVTIITPEKVLHFNGRKDAAVEPIEFLGLRTRYFCLIVEPQEKNYRAGIKKISNQAAQLYLQPPEITLAPGQSIKQKFRIYLGPQELRTINRIKPEWSAVMHYGTFNFIAQFLLQLLEWIHRVVPNWGWTVIILSLLIYLLLFPLTLKQMRSMKAMQALQPRIEELRRVYKDNPQRLNKEIMELYKEHRVNPFGGCLPLVLQIPIFFALYQVLMRSVALKGAKFLWIKDLSEPDRLFILPRSLPILGNEINILPLVMAVGMLLQQKLSAPSAATGSSAEQQKLMTIFFPIMFGLIFYKMPSGLVLYWFINSSLMLFYQWRISRRR